MSLFREIGAAVILTIASSMMGLNVHAESLDDLALPTPKRESFSRAVMKIGKGSSIVADDAIRRRFKEAFFSLEQTIGMLPHEGNVIQLVVRNRKPASRGVAVDGDNQRKESYQIVVSSSSISVTSTAPRGLLRGLTTLEYLIRAKKGVLYQGAIIDWPDHAIRAIHIPIQGVSSEEIMRLIHRARFGHFNTIILELATTVRLKTLEKFGLVSPFAWELHELQRVLQYAHENGFEVIPEVALLTHQEKLLKDKYPELMFNAKTYDPRKGAVYDIVYPLLDEVVAFMRPAALHIGHDEVAGFNDVSRGKWLRKGEEILPPALYGEHIRRIHAYLADKNITTWIWGDMLIAPDGFPGMDMKHGFHGANGFSDVLSEIPKDVVVCDWHYMDDQMGFPSSRYFAVQGHPVLGATWQRKKTIRNFSNYMAKDNPGSMGMIATTWYYVQRKQWHVVSSIIRDSGEYFWNAN